MSEALVPACEPVLLQPAEEPAAGGNPEAVSAGELEDVLAAITRRHLDECDLRDVHLSRADPGVEWLRAVRLMHVRFRRPADIHNGLQGFLASVHQFSLPFMYYLACQVGEIRLCVGLWAEDAEDGERLRRAYGAETGSLESALRGFFPGCEVRRLYAEMGGGGGMVKRDIEIRMANLHHRRVITGIPCRKEAEKAGEEGRTSSGLELLTDAIGGDFVLLVHARPVLRTDCRRMLQRVEDVHDWAHWASRRSEQISRNRSIGGGFSVAHGASSQETHSSGSGTSTTITDSSSHQDTHSRGTSTGTSTTDSVSHQDTHSTSSGGSTSVSNREGNILSRVGKGAWRTLAGGESTTRQVTGQNSEQAGTSDGTSHSDGTTRQESEQHGTSDGTSHSDGTTRQESEQIGTSDGTSRSEGRTDQENRQDSLSTGASRTETRSGQWNDGEGRTWSAERTSKLAATVEDLLNRMHRRILEGSGMGMWLCTTEVFAESPAQADRIARQICGHWSGREGGLDPLRAVPAPASATPWNLPALRVMGRNHPLGPDFEGVQTLLTTDELALAAQLPLHEIPGIPVETLCDFGRSWQDSGADGAGRICLGTLTDRGNETSRAFSLAPDRLLRHCFVSGATGSGKSNTMRRLLVDLWLNCHVPFMVIEPVKTEYHALRSRLGDDLRTFSLGMPGAGFSLDPFDFDPRVGLVQHIDLLKAAFTASLGLYSGMPFILERVIYDSYVGHGWDPLSGRNGALEARAAELGVPPDGALRREFLPSLSELAVMVPPVIDELFPQGTEYGRNLGGALRSRLTSLARGAKGELLNRGGGTISLAELLRGPCVLELQGFADNEEKALVMALLLMRLYEHRQGLELRRGVREERPLEHFLVIEEAHRLLARPVGGGEMEARGRQKGVEVFADILAEIRSYGQGLAIVDQIPSKLIPDVLRNTDLKIAHRLVDKEDREILGATMNLEDGQIRELARFAPGDACVYCGSMRKPLRVRIGKEEIAEDAGTAAFRSPVDADSWMGLRACGYDGPEDDALWPRDGEAAGRRACLWLLCALTGGADGLARLREHWPAPRDPDPADAPDRRDARLLLLLLRGLALAFRSRGDAAGSDALIRAGQDLCRRWMARTGMEEAFARLRRTAEDSGLSAEGILDAWLAMRGTRGVLLRVLGAAEGDASGTEPRLDDGLARMFWAPLAPSHARALLRPMIAACADDGGLSAATRENLRRLVEGWDAEAHGGKR